MEFLQPPDWPRAKGYSNGIKARGTMVFIAGEIGWNPVTEKIETDDFVEQFRQALRNIVAIMEQGGAKPEHIVRMTWFVTDKQEYLGNLPGIGEAYREVIGRHFPGDGRDRDQRPDGTGRQGGDRDDRHHPRLASSHLAFGPPLPQTRSVRSNR